MKNTFTITDSNIRIMLPGETSAPESAPGYDAGMKGTPLTRAIATGIIVVSSLLLLAMSL